MRPNGFDSHPLRALLAALVVLAATACAATAQEPTPGAVALREGIVVHPTAAEAYVMAPGGGIEAIDLDSGTVRWRSDAADKPLVLVEERLVGQVEPETAEDTNRLELAVLDVRAPGERGAADSIELPQRVRVSVGDTLEGSFRVSGRPSDGAADVSWTFTPIPRQGLLPPPEEQGAQDALEGTSGGAVSGSVRIEVATGEVARSETAMPESAQPTPAWKLPAAEIDERANLPQYLSADGRHVLVSERIADDRVWEKYRWTVHDRESGRQIGETRSHVSFTPFVVRDGMLVYETTPYIPPGGSEEPAKLRGVSLETGEEVWSVPVREVVWRGPVPP